MPDPLSVLRVLLVDDDADTVESLVTILSLWGYEPLATCSGPDALAAAAGFSPDVALLDLGLPGMDGHEVGRRLRALPGLEGVALVALTGYSDEEYRRRSGHAGFVFHLVKPVEPDDLKKVLDTLAWKKVRRQGEAD